MTHAQQNHATAQESSKASAAKAVEIFTSMVPACGAFHAEIPEDRANYISGNNVIEKFCIRFESSPIIIIMVQVEINKRTGWGYYVYKSERVKNPKFNGYLSEMSAVLRNFEYDLRHSVEDFLINNGDLELVAGDILVASWGYNQTNVDFYKIVSIGKTKKTAKIVPIGEIKEYNAQTMTGYTKPNPDIEGKDSILRKKFGKDSLYGFKYSGAFLKKWDGKPCFYSNYA